MTPKNSEVEVRLGELRYVGDLAVTGSHIFSGDGTATADLDLAGASEATFELILAALSGDRPDARHRHPQRPAVPRNRPHRL